MAADDGLDNPGSDPAGDAFGRWQLSKRLADLIAEFDTSNGAPVFGIYGKWGSGKTTVLNYLKAELERNYADKVVIFNFNPWRFMNEDDLLATFYLELAKYLKISLGTVAKRVGDILQTGSFVFGLIPAVGSAAQKLADLTGKKTVGRLPREPA